MSRPTTDLMHAVLDGEASAAEAATLQRLLVADPAARAEFEALQHLFSGLASVPQRQPPEGLVAAVNAALDARQPALRQQPQLSLWSRVFASAPWEWISRISTNVVRNIDMSQQPRSPFGNRKLWIGGAVAAAAVVVVAQFGFDSKPNEKDVIGTIAPAERYRAPQPTAADVKVGATAGGQTGKADGNAPVESAQKAVTDMAAGKVADKSTNMVVGKIVDKSADMVAGKVVDKSADMVAGKVVDKSADRVAEKVADKSAQMVAGKVAEKSADMAVGKAADKAAAAAAERAAEMAAAKAAK